MVFMFFCAHSVKDKIIGTSDFPVSVSSYSTFMGTCGNTVRFTKPSASNVCRVLERTLVEMSGINFANWLNRDGLFSLRTKITSKAHLFPKRATTFRMGQISIMEFFSSFFAMLMDCFSAKVTFWLLDYNFVSCCFIIV